MSRKSKQSKKAKTNWQAYSWDFIKTLGISLILALMIKTSIVEAYIIPTGSMENTLLAGDYIIGNKFIYGMRLPIPFVNIKLPAITDPEPGDIVIFKNPLDPNQNYIKRCIAIEGQTVEIRNKQVFVDGKPVPLPPEGQHIDERIIPSFDQAAWGIYLRDNMSPIKVPKDRLFMMGDNRDNSLDSRFWGFLDRKLVQGRALMVLWSWKYPDSIPSSSGALSSLDLWLYNLKHFPQLLMNMRWKRLAKIAS
jgi:signal peptidase I